MSLPPWSPRDSLGNPIVDAEHQKLLELLQWLEGELFLEHDMDNAKVAALAKELNSHVDQHFFHEEEFMRSLPGLSDEEKAAHARDHEQWRARIQEHLPSLLRANTDLERRAHLARILRVAKSFWQEHFQTFDRKLGDHKP